LAETGLVGGLLAVGAFLLLLYTAARTVRARAPGSPRLLAGALLAGSLAYAIHTLYDWDWNIPAVTLPALLMLGVLVGAAAPPGRQPLTPAAGKTLALGALVTWLCAFALSAALPSISASDASSALISASSSSPGALAGARSDASLASSLDPLSDAGPRAEATIALREGRLSRARVYLSEAVGRDPTDELAWNQLAALYAQVGDSSDAAIAARRVVALDPRGQLARALAHAHLVPGP
jgi:tetratricopeptide (TPR) repeat protein